MTEARPRQSNSSFLLGFSPVILSLSPDHQRRSGRPHARGV